MAIGTTPGTPGKSLGSLVRRTDDLFALNWDSLMATQLSGHINLALAVEVPVKALFDAPTVRGVAAAVLQAKLLKLDHEELEALFGESA